MDSDKRRKEPKVKTERPDPKAAKQPPKPGAKDRPGFDLGGSGEDQPSGPTGSNVVPGGPKDRPAPAGGTTGRAGGGRSDIGGSRGGGGGRGSGKP